MFIWAQIDDQRQHSLATDDVQTSDTSEAICVPTAVSVWPGPGSRRFRGESRSVTRCAGPGLPGPRGTNADSARLTGGPTARAVGRRFPCSGAWVAGRLHASASAGGLAVGACWQAPSRVVRVADTLRNDIFCSGACAMEDHTRRRASPEPCWCCCRTSSGSVVPLGEPDNVGRHSSPARWPHAVRRRQGRGGHG